MSWGFTRWFISHHWLATLIALAFAFVLVVALSAIVGGVSSVIGLGVAALVGIEVTTLEAVGIGLTFLITCNVFLTALMR